MVFNSTEFFIFFSIFLVAYWLFRNFRLWQNVLLVAGSMYFYSCFHYSFPIYLGALITATYLFGILIDKTEDDLKRKIGQYVAVFTITIGLIYLKYSGLIIGNMKGLTQWEASSLHLLVPVGISFYTFSCIGYILNVYRGKQPAEQNFINLAAYISFFPHLLTGPIPAAKSILPQFSKKSTLTLDGIDQSVGEILWGLFKKMVVADNIRLGADYCFSNYTELQGSTLFIGVILFYFQLYADFSGYSDMARGLARLLGIDIVRNFNAPFTAKSITEFWRRWHISLTNWFYEYVFNPIVMAFRGIGSTAIAIAILLTFSLSGIWHGADWKFAVWGLLHSLAMIYEYYTTNVREKFFTKIPAWTGSMIGISLTLFYAILAESFFRADSIQDGFAIDTKILSAGLFSRPEGFVASYLKWCVPLLVIELVQRKGSYTFDLDQWGLTLRLSKLTSNSRSVIAFKYSLKVFLYLALGYCTWLFYKKVNMAEYYYFKF